MRAPNDTPPGSRGQAFTLEAVVASVVVLGSLLFALQVSGVTALTVSTSSGQLLEQQDATAAGTLDAGAATESLRPTLLYWDDEERTFHGLSPDEEYYTTGPPTAFGALVNETLLNRSLAANVDLHYIDEDGEVGRQSLVKSGTPSDDAAAATRTVTLYDDDELVNADGSTSDTTLSEADTFYMPDAYPDGPVYNVVRVEVVVWPV